MKKLTFVFTLTIITFLSKAQVLTTLAGSGTAALTNGTGTVAAFNKPTGICSDGTGNFYVTDFNNSTVRKVTSTGVVTTVLSNSGTPVFINQPTGICIDASGNLYVTEYVSCKIDKIAPSGVVSTLAGSGTYGLVDGTGAGAQFAYPNGICNDGSGNFYVSEYGNGTVRKVTPAGVVTTVLTNSGTPVSMPTAGGLCVDPSGNIYVTISQGTKLMKITPAGIVTVFAGSNTPMGSVDGTGTAACFNLPKAVCIDPSGNLYVSEFGGNKIRKVTPATVVTTLSGTGNGGSYNSTQPTGICLYGNDIYIADNYAHLIRKLSLPVSTGIEDINESKLANIYPNPSNGLFMIDLKSAAQIIVTNTLGQTILTETMNPGKHQIDLQKQANGVYFVKVVQGKQQQIIKLIKE